MTARAFETIGARITTPSREVLLDVALDFSHAASLEVTEYPVEEGADIQDHVRQRPRMLEMTAVVSAEPVAEQLQGQIDRDRDVWTDLVEISQSYELCTIDTDLETYENYLLADVSTTTTKDVGQGLMIQLSFRPYRSVTFETTTIPPEIRQDRTTERGQQQTQDVSPAEAAEAAEEAQRRTAAASLFDSITG